MGIEPTTFQTLAECSNHRATATSTLFFFAKLLHAKPKDARNEAFLVWAPCLIVIITLWFAIALDEIRTRRILREKADRKQSIHLWADITTNKVYYVICANGE